MARAALVANQDLPEAGFVGDALERRGFRLDLLVREAGGWPEPSDFELVLVLGSDWHAYDERVRREVEAEAAFVRAAHDRRTPVLGICFGAQMLSHALGGTVRRADAIELGWLTVESLHPAVPSGPWMQWHSDTFTLPPGAELLAQSPIGPQAFRLGRSLAVQFHPEVDTDMVTDWARADDGRDLVEAGIDAEALIERATVETTRSEPAARRLVDWFCTVVANA